MTFSEFYAYSEGHRLRQEREWERTRFLGAILINVNVSKKSKQVSPQDLVKLSFDSNKNKRHAAKMTREEFEALKEKWDPNNPKRRVVSDKITGPVKRK